MKHRRKRSITALYAVVIAGLIIVSCEKYGYVIVEVDPEIPVLFQTEIQPIFTSACVMCHKGARDPDLRDGNSFVSLTEGGYVTLPAETSRLYKTLESTSHKSFTLPEQRQKILYWIEQGAKNN